MKKIVIFIFTMIAISESYSQCPTFNLNLSQAPNYCVVKPFGVGRNNGNSDMNLAERGIYFDAYQSSNGFRYRYSNYQPMAIEYHPWAKKMFFKYVDGSQPIVAGSEITTWKDAMTIENVTGKIKIGDVTTPGNYKLYVESGILTELVTVALHGTNDWADYVFNEEYNLLSIQELRSFINEHRHLPNIPSAEEVVKNGNNLAETDKFLLEKIEELTLYIIELHDRIETLEKRQN